MANTTVYPYGTGGNLPASIGVINDRTTGGADKAWSAEQGKIVCQQADESEDEIFKMNADEINIFAYTEKTNWYINSSGKWAKGSGGSYGCKLVPITPGQRYRIYGQATIAFLADDTMVEGGDVNFCDGIEGRFAVNAGEVYDIVAPADAAFLYFLSTSGGTAKSFNGWTSGPDYSFANCRFRVSGLVEMMQGTVSTNGNLWQVIGTINSTTIGEKFGHGFVSVNLIAVTPADVLEIDYAKMGIDDTKWKIGIEELDKDGQVFNVSGGGTTGTIRYFLTDGNVTFNKETRFIRIVLYLRDTSSYTLSDNFNMRVSFPVYSMPELSLCKDFVTSTGTAPTYPVFRRFSYSVEKTDIAFDVEATLDYQGKEYGFNNGYLYIPEEYRNTGEPLPLIIFCHGTAGVDFSDMEPTYDSMLIALAKGGYIVADCSTLSSFYYNNDEGVSMTVRDANFAEPMAFECYNKLYLYLTKRFNIDPNRVYIYGKSAGGLNVLILSQMGIIPVKAAAGLAASVDLITNMRVLGYASTTTNPFLHRIGLTDANVADKLLGSGDADYLVAHFDKIAGFNPFWYKTFGLDWETQTRRCITDGIDSATIEADTTLQNAVAQAANFLRVPMKWWQALDDENVPIATTRLYQKMVRKGGGIFEIRELPENCGKHHAVDHAENAPTTTYTHRNGVTVTLPVAYAEMLDWFLMWW